MPYYACPEHPDEYVTRQGTGCPYCEWEAAERRGEHRKRGPRPEPWELAFTERSQS